MPQVSVIVPIYNVEKYLPQCLDSLTSQTLKNIEIICINDGSPDNCLQILQSYAARDSRIKIINKQNAGVSCARNDGLALATAPYISFVDPDDWMEPKAYEILVKIMEKEQVDMINFNFRYVYQDGRIVDTHSKMASPASIRKVFLTDDLICSSNLQGCIWKLFKRSIIVENNIQFMPHLCTAEDLAFQYKYVCLAQNIAFIDNIFYNYRIHDTSIMGQLRNEPSKRAKHIKDGLTSVFDVYSFIDSHNLWNSKKNIVIRYFMQTLHDTQKRVSKDLIESLHTNALELAKTINQKHPDNELTYFIEGKYHKIFDLHHYKWWQKIFSIRKQGKRLVISVLGMKIRKNLK